MIIRQMLTGDIDVCCYILGCEETRQGLVFDPGGDEDKILAAVNELGLQIKYIVNSHYHPDHTHGNQMLKKAFGARVVIHEADNAMLTNQQAIDFFAPQGMSMTLPADRTVKDGDILAIGTIRVQVLHTPGHSPGSICLLAEGNLFAGDTLFVGGSGRTDVPGGSIDRLLESLAIKIAVLPPETVVWPGHDYDDTLQSTLAVEMQENMFLNGEMAKWVKKAAQKATL
ncbi:MAG: MBL fold metallo-hydrolase [Proteobacteria bacterium]|nr:MBL fold metallo-hydrolase [Pseudomonadota bacterium]MBU1709977.1 MBL fold metallo-hydrolase [Pseudomonadota bacterium]